MGELIALHGYHWIGIVTLEFSDAEYDTPDLQIGPFRSKKALKSWKRKFIRSLFQICRRMPNIKKYWVDYTEIRICYPATDNKIVPPENPQNFAGEFLKIALNDWVILNPRNYFSRKAKQ